MFRIEPGCASTRFDGLERRGAYAAVLLLLASLTGCQGYQASQPLDNERILTVTNTAPLRTPMVPINSLPLPLPSLPANDPRIRQGQTATGPKTAIVGAPDAPFLLGPATPVADTTQSPYSAVGRSTFVFSSSSQAWNCTGQVIGSDGVLLTAGHCVWDTASRSWIQSEVFQRQYNGGASVGNYDWQCAAVFSGWTNGSYPYDYAFIKLRGAPAAGADVLINVGAQPSVDAVGYSINYDINRMYHAVGAKDGGNPSTMDSTLSHGSSGGGWFVQSNAISLNSYGINGDTSHVHGPQFTGATLALYDFVRRGCVDNVHVANQAQAQALSLPSSAKVLITPSDSDVSGGAMISRVDHSASCGGSTEFVLRNNTSGLRLIGVRRIRYRPPASPATSYDYFELDPQSSKTLGCSGSANSSASKQGDVTDEARVFYDHRNNLRATHPPLAGNAPLETVLISKDVTECIPKCKNVSTDECLVLGTSYIPIMAPLARFLDSTQNSSAHPNGLLIAKSEIIKGFGGDPATAQDLCARGDINKEGDTATNTGLACIVRAENPIPDGSGFAVRLVMDARTVATPSSWNPALRALTTSVPVVYFRDRAAGVHLEFEGANQAADNANYGGDINGIAAASTNQLIVSTSNGCVRGYYAKP